jgi:hypothetical protein
MNVIKGGSVGEHGRGVSAVTRAHRFGHYLIQSRREKACKIASLAVLSSSKKEDGLTSSSL